MTKALVIRHARRHPTYNAQQLLTTFDLEGLVARFGRVPEFEVVGADKRKWTFWTYASRAIVVMGERGTPIKKQLRKLRDNIIARVRRDVSEIRR